MKTLNPKPIMSTRVEVGVSQNSGYLSGGPHNKDYSIFGVYVGVLLLWETTKLLV